MSAKSELSGPKKTAAVHQDSVSLPPNRIDVEFQRLMEFIKERNVSQITESIKQNLRHLSVTNYPLYHSSVAYYNKHRLWGTYSPEQEDYALAENRAHALVEHRADFEWLYGVLKDFRSRRILVNILYYWLMSDSQKIEQIHDQTFDQYFDLDLVSCDKNEVFVDVGGYIGDTLVNYSQTFGNTCYRKMYCYEIVPANIEYIEKNIKLFHLDNVIIREKGASDKPGTMYLTSDTLDSESQLSENGAIAVPTVKIDDDIEEDVTFIKMDIEGGEEKALFGCVEKIKKSHPKLALSIYHNHRDIWRLARIIYEADPSYRFYIRYYGTAILPTEYILYGI